MNRLSKFLALLIAATLTVAAAQTSVEPQFYTPFGTVEFDGYTPIDGYDPETLEEDAEGHLWVRTISPDSQGIDVTLLGPDGFFAFEEIADEHLFDELRPGTYLIAATDDGLEMLTTKVDITAGMVAPVTLTMQPISTTRFDSVEYAPYGTFRLEPYEPLADDTDPERGELIVDFGFSAMAEDSDADFDVNGVVVGPNDFRVNLDDLNEAAEFDDLEPGVYLIALTTENGNISDGIVEVRANQLVRTTVMLDVLR